MPKLVPRDLLQRATSYLREHPEEIARALRGALGLRFGVPLDALRFLATELGGGKKAPRDVVIQSAPPGLRLAATVDQMGATMRVSLVVFAEELHITAGEIRVAIRIADLAIEILGESDAPLAGLIRSGALDLSKPGNLVAFMPKRPPLLVEAKDDRLVLDLMLLPSIAADARVKRTLQVLTPVVGLRAVTCKDDHIDLHLKATLSGVPAAIAAARIPV